MPNSSDLYIDALDGLLVTCTVPVSDGFGWTTFAAMVWRQTSQIVNTAAGAVIAVTTIKMSPSNASPVGPTIANRL